MMNTGKVGSNIILIGFSATGKSIIAKEIAKHLNWHLIDTDDEIVKLSGRTIAEIFAQDGEDSFRELEHQIIKEACRQKEVVITSGGGAILDPENRELLINSGVII